MVSREDFIKNVIRNPDIDINKLCRACGTSYNKFKLLFPSGIRELLENVILQLKNSENRRNALVTLSDIANHRLCQLNQSKLQIFDCPSVKIPIFPSEKLAEIVGLTIGDGEIWLDRKRKPHVPRAVRFFNKDELILNHYRESTFEIFGLNSDIRKRVIDHTRTKSLSNKIQYATYLEYRNTTHATILNMLGVPAGAKPFSSFRVPQWIRENSTEIKKGFIRGLWTTDGSLPYATNLRTMTFQMEYSHWKSKEKIKDGIIFLNDIKEILHELGIESCNIIQDNKCYKKGTDRETHSLRLTINTNRDIAKFYSIIGFVNSLKLQTFSKRMILVD